MHTLIQEVQHTIVTMEPGPWRRAQLVFKTAQRLLVPGLHVQVQFPLLTMVLPELLLIHRLAIPELQRLLVLMEQWPLLHRLHRVRPVPVLVRQVP
jgi:hypothetical protein